MREQPLPQNFAQPYHKPVKCISTYIICTEVWPRFRCPTFGYNWKASGDNNPGHSACRVDSNITCEIGVPILEGTQKWVSCLAVITLAVINCFNTKPASKSGEAFLAMKFATVALVLLSSRTQKRKSNV